MEENQIIILVKNGEADAYRELVDRYQAGLIIHCDRFINDRAAAEDVAQDAFVKAYYKLNKFDSTKSSFSTWLYSIATNTAKDYLRKAHKTTLLENSEDIVECPPQLSKEEISDVQRAVQNLRPPEYSHVVRAYYWEGKGYDEIASELHVPTSTVGTWLKRAKVQLRKELI